jgi:molybdenum cofactor cytidylyltransferase
MSNDGLVVGIVLAAGTSSRYRAAAGAEHDNKLLLPISGKTVLAHAIEAVRRGGVDEQCVVTGHQAQTVRAAIEAGSDNARITIVHNPDYAAGEMVSSIQAGLRHIQARGDAGAALIALGDMPLLPASVVARLVDAWRRGCGQILAPRTGDQRGHPVLLGHQFWDEALMLPHGAPVRQLLSKHLDHVTLLQVDDPRVLADVDTPALYADALTQASASPGRR